MVCAFIAPRVMLRGFCTLWFSLLRQKICLSTGASAFIAYFHLPLRGCWEIGGIDGRMTMDDFENPSSLRLCNISRSQHSAIYSILCRYTILYSVKHIMEIYNTVQCIAYYGYIQYCTMYSILLIYTILYNV